MLTVATESTSASTVGMMIQLRFRWVGLATTRIAEDDELLSLAAKSGCRGLLIGFESISQDTLIETKKGFHASKKYAEVIKRLNIRME